MAARDDLDGRHAIAASLHKIPTSCPADLHEWAETGLQVAEDEFGDVTSRPIPNTSSGAVCAMEAAVHKHRSCWCGKFRAGLELVTAEALPVHELAFAADPSRWFPSIEPDEEFPEDPDRDRDRRIADQMEVL